jgi:hypothetical protein
MWSGTLLLPDAKGSSKKSVKVKSHQKDDFGFETWFLGSPSARDFGRDRLVKRDTYVEWRGSLM